MSVSKRFKREARREILRLREQRVREQDPEIGYLLRKGYKKMGDKFVKRQRGTMITITSRGSGNWVYELRKGSKRHTGNVSSPVMADQYAQNDIRMDFWTGRTRDQYR